MISCTPTNATRERFRKRVAQQNARKVLLTIHEHDPAHGLTPVDPFLTDKLEDYDPTRAPDGRPLGFFEIAERALERDSERKDDYAHFPQWWCFEGKP